MNWWDSCEFLGERDNTQIHLNLNSLEWNHNSLVPSEQENSGNTKEALQRVTVVFPDSQGTTIFPIIYCLGHFTQSQRHNLMSHLDLLERAQSRCYTVFFDHSE